VIRTAALVLSLAAALPSTAASEILPSPAVSSRAAELRSGWGDLDGRARTFLRTPAVVSSIRGGGVAVDRAALFLAAEKALSGGRAGYSLMFFDPSGDPLAWAGRAPAFYPTREPAGAIWSAESVIFYRTLSVEFPAGTRAGAVIAGWRLSRSKAGSFLSPAGSPWHDAGLEPWGGVESAKRDRARARESARRAAIALDLGVSLALLAFALARPPAGLRLAAFASAASLLWASAGAATLVSAPLKLDVNDYARELPVVAAFVLAVAAAAFFARRRPGYRGTILPVIAVLAAFLAGTVRPTTAGVACCFALVLAAILASSGPTIRRSLGTAVVAAAVLFGPIVLWRQERAVASAREQTEKARREAATPARAVELATKAFAGRLGDVASRFAGAREQDLGDLAFVLWKETGLADAAPISGVRLWHDGRIVSRFSSGFPFESDTTVNVGGETPGIIRRRFALPSRQEFAAGEAPDEAEVEAVDWPVWRALPDPLRLYRQLLLGLDPAPPAEAPRISERFVESLTAASAAVLAGFGLALAGAALYLLVSRRRVRLRPLTFRGRITGLFTVLVLVPFLAVTIYIRHTLAVRLRRETVAHAQTALETARTVLDDYLFAAGTSPGRRQLIDDDLLSWMAKIVGHDLSIYADGRLFSTSRRELFASGLLPERIDGATLGKILHSPAGFVVETRVVMRRPFDQVEAALASIPGRLTLSGPAVVSIPLLPEQRETEEEIARLSASLTLFTLAVFGLSLLLGARTAFRVTGPIGDLVEGTHAVARGEVPRIPVPADEELKRLVDAFLSMAETLEEQREDLARAQRLRAWAEMARIIAHEIKNPLTPIRLSAEHLREVWRRGDPSRDRVLEECLSNILAQTEALRGIAAEFSDYARLPEPSREPVRLLPLVETVLSGYAASPKIRWEIEVPDVVATADARLVARALTNLVANAREALGEQGGRIAVRLLPRGSRWALRVEDDGPGVSPENFDKLFEPYFSSKSGGSGLGLAIVRKIAEEHGGDAKAFRLTPRGFAVEFDFADVAQAPGAGGP
jgi:signal transduction histidine kinase